MIIVTGGAGFIGSNIVHRLNEGGETDILVVDDLADGHKILNLRNCMIEDYLHYEDFHERLQSGYSFGNDVRAVLHQGACTDTTEWDGVRMMRDNFEFSKSLLHYCTGHRIPLIYASSASVYGAGRDSGIDPVNERPINVYAFSKLMFDRYVRSCDAAGTPVVGLRYFNVYGPGEAHKGRMASVIHHFHHQILDAGELRLFAGCDGFDDGEQRRDFIHVDDVAAVNLWFLDHGGPSGIYNLGTGRSRSFNDVAAALIDWHGRGSIRYVPFPDHLRGSYQSFTEADLTGLRAAGYVAEFVPLETGVRRYLDVLAAADGNP